MRMFNIHENEKNSVSWPTVSFHTQDRPWRVSGNDQLASANESSIKIFMVVHSGMTVVGMLKITK